MEPLILPCDWCGEDVELDDDAQRLRTVVCPKCKSTNRLIFEDGAELVIPED